MEIMSQELLQQIAVNTSHVKTKLISIVTEEPEFSVEFPSPLQASEMALTQLRCYYSWPNVRAEPFGDKLPNNSFTFSYKKEPMEHQNGIQYIYQLELMT